MDTSKKFLNPYSSKLSGKPACSEQGFALVVTVATLALLVLLALALMGLAQSEIRTTNQYKNKTIARHNAVMAMKQAIGQLQLSMGPDQMISANASILGDPTSGSSDVIHPHWSGSWHPWRAGTPLPSETCIDEISDHQTIPGVTGEGMSPTYVENRSDHFNRWLVSLTDEEARSINTPLDLVLDGSTRPDSDANAVHLVAAGTLGDESDPNDFVKARLIDVWSEQEQRTGRYGWWVSDESLKARIMADPYETNSQLTMGQSLFRQQAAGSTGTKVTNGLEALADDSELNNLVSMQTLNLVDGVSGKPSENFHHITSASFGIPADVREGGLKKDLSVLLEQDIRSSDTDDRFMLYRFDEAGRERVPIQDLSAYYQLYDDDTDWIRSRRGGVKHESTGIEIHSPDLGKSADSNREKYLREYTSIYRNPVPIKVQFLVAMAAAPITDEHRAMANSKPNREPIPPEDSHRLLLGAMPVVTLWNPTNLPMVMNHSQRFMLNTPPFAFKWRKYDASEDDYESKYFNLNYAQGESVGDGRATRLHPHVINFSFAKSAPIVFEPGEVKMFSLDASNNLSVLDPDAGVQSNVQRLQEPVNEWNPFAFFNYWNATTGTGSWNSQHVAYIDDVGKNIVFNAADKITVEIVTEGIRGGKNNRPHIGTNTAVMNEVFGGAFNFYMLDEDFADFGANRHHFRHYQMISRYGGGTKGADDVMADFNHDLVLMGFPGREPIIPFDSEIDAVPGSQLIGASNAGEAKAFCQFSMIAGCEANSQSLGGFGGGRNLTSRPFLHGSTIAGTFIDHNDTNSLYNVGWEWQVGRINEVEDSIVQGTPDTGNGYFGGGYTIEAGTTHVVQQFLPVAPPISIASLSSAHLGGFSLATDPVALGANDDVFWKTENYRNPAPNTAFREPTATGFGGLAPHTMQAIGNSYAHPLIPAGRAYTTKTRQYDEEFPSWEATFADHSYLANKALWDDFFFSSITPQRSAIRVFDNGDRSAEEVANDFFFNGVPLPNRRMHPITSSLNEEVFDALFAQKDVFRGGLADKIAAHLMIKGAFNINSTSVEAWKIFLSSLRDKPVGTLDDNGQLTTTSTDGVPVGPGVLPVGESVTTEDITSFNAPAEQWSSFRVLTDEEIEELATAMVKQVKLRGPFLSLSEFVNRRLDPSNPELSAKGALQAALDDPDVSINAPFRTSARQFSDAEVADLTPEFREALEGPIAYGSAAYVDQADVLRHFGGQLTPRGDTFVIRSYGDALDANGNVTARAWCEAVVQRLPDYVDSSDDPHLSPAELPESSQASRRFGRKIQLVSFRWLHPSEL